MDSWLSRGLVSISKCSASLARACVLALAAGRALGCMKPLAKRWPEPRGHFFPTHEDRLTRAPRRAKAWGRALYVSYVKGNAVSWLPRQLPVALTVTPVH